MTDQEAIYEVRLQVRFQFPRHKMAKILSLKLQMDFYISFLIWETERISIYHPYDHVFLQCLLFPFIVLESTIFLH